MPDGTSHDGSRHRAGTRFGRWMQDVVITQYENNIYAFVFMGAMFLVFIVGLRGLGKDAQDIGGFVLWFIDKQSGRISEKWVFAALLFECLMLFVMAVTLFFKPEEDGKHKTPTTTATITESHIGITVSGPKGEVVKDLRKIISQIE